ncbi:Uncharacterised protein [Mycobacteroides abscessus]|nr:Uncharacterised protein [Mycobacteroides abscessus]
MTSIGVTMSWTNRCGLFSSAISSVISRAQ